MPYLRPALSRRLTRRTCLECGHQGRELQGQAGLTTLSCPRCGADLYTRPPRSYAEMEGLVDVAVTPNSAAQARGADLKPRLHPPIEPMRSRSLSPAARAVLFLGIALTCVAAAFFVF